MARASRRIVTAGTPAWLYPVTKPRRHHEGARIFLETQMGLPIPAFSCWSLTTLSPHFNLNQFKFRNNNSVLHVWLLVLVYKTLCRSNSLGTIVNIIMWSDIDKKIHMDIEEEITDGELPFLLSVMIRYSIYFITGYNFSSSINMGREILQIHIYT